MLLRERRWTLNFTHHHPQADVQAVSWGSGRGLLEVYWGWTDAASAGHLEEVY